MYYSINSSDSVCQSDKANLISNKAFWGLSVLRTSPFSGDNGIHLVSVSFEQSEHEPKTVYRLPCCRFGQPSLPCKPILSRRASKFSHISYNVNDAIGCTTVFNIVVVLIWIKSFALSATMRMYVLARPFLWLRQEIIFYFIICCDFVFSRSGILSHPFCIDYCKPILVKTLQIRKSKITPTPPYMWSLFASHIQCGPHSPVQLPP